MLLSRNLAPEVGKPMTTSMSNIDKLRDGGVITRDAVFTEKDIETIERLTAVEVDALIKLKKDLGDEFIKQYLCPDPPQGIIL